MTDQNYPQLRITPARFLNPETTEALLDKLYKAGGIRRLILNGPNLPMTVPYGPARGTPNENSYRRVIKVCGEDYDLHVHVGTLLLELENEESIPAIKQACDEVFANKFAYGIRQGIFMRSSMTLTDYAKYGVVEDDRMFGMADPKSKQKPIIIQGVK